MSFTLYIHSEFSEPLEDTTQLHLTEEKKTETIKKFNLEHKSNGTVEGSNSSTWFNKSNGKYYTFVIND